MKTYILLFRGINVGGKNILPMKELASVLAGLGFEGVQTYIQSGNVVLQGKKKPAAGVMSAIETKFGFRPELMALEASEFEVLVKSCPFKSDDGKLLHFYFLNDKPKPNAEKFEKYVASSEQYEIKDKVLYLLAPDGIGRSKLVANIEACLGAPATGRNLNTVVKLLEMVRTVEELC